MGDEKGEEMVWHPYKSLGFRYEYERLVKRNRV